MNLDSETGDSIAGRLVVIITTTMMNRLVLDVGNKPFTLAIRFKRGFAY